MKDGFLIERIQDGKVDSVRVHCSGADCFLEEFPTGGFGMYAFSDGWQRADGKPQHADQLCWLQGLGEGNDKPIPDHMARHYHRAARQIGDLFCWCVKNLRKFPPIEGDWLDVVKERLKGSGRLHARPLDDDGAIEFFPPTQPPPPAFDQVESGLASGEPDWGRATQEAQASIKAADEAVERYGGGKPDAVQRIQWLAAEDIGRIFSGKAEAELRKIVEAIPATSHAELVEENRRLQFDNDLLKPQCKVLVGQLKAAQAQLREREAEVARLKIENDGYRAGFDTQHAEIARLQRELVEATRRANIFDTACADMSAAADGIRGHFDSDRQIKGDGKWRLLEIAKHANRIDECFGIAVAELNKPHAEVGQNE